MLNFNQDFRLQQYSGVLKYYWKWNVYAEMAFLWFTSLVVYVLSYIPVLR